MHVYIACESCMQLWLWPSSHPRDSAWPILKLQIGVPSALQDTHDAVDDHLRGF